MTASLLQMSEIKMQIQVLVKIAHNTYVSGILALCFSVQTFSKGNTDLIGTEIHKTQNNKPQTHLTSTDSSYSHDCNTSKSARPKSRITFSPFLHQTIETACVEYSLLAVADFCKKQQQHNKPTHGRS